MPAQPFLDRLHRADPASGGLSLEDLRREPTVYLLPVCEDEAEARECTEKLCRQILEEQLGGWYRVPSSWPSRRDLDTFDRWFEWSVHSVVVDLSDDPLLREELRPARVLPLAGIGDGLDYRTVRDLGDRFGVAGKKIRGPETGPPR